MKIKFCRAYSTLKYLSSPADDIHVQMCVCVCANYLLSDRLPYNPTDWNQISIHWSFSVPHVVRQPVSGSLGQTLTSLEDVLEQHTSVLGVKPCLIFIHGTRERDLNIPLHLLWTIYYKLLLT